MKRKIGTVNFICDECKQESGHNPELNWQNNPPHPFPYLDGWIYIHNMTIKTLKGRIEINEKHFCNENCFVIYLHSQMEIKDGQKTKGI